MGSKILKRGPGINGKDVKKQNKQGLYTARVWLSEARKRVEGGKKGKESQDMLPSATTAEKFRQLGRGESKIYILL
jgi:hypothetical protein